jgi:hypothetical protein
MSSKFKLISAISRELGTEHEADLPKESSKQASLVKSTPTSSFPQGYTAHPLGPRNH